MSENNLTQKSEIATSISISNTDVVTMLMVKNKKHLNTKRSDLIDRKFHLFLEYGKVKYKFLKIVEKNEKIKTITDSLINIVSVFTKTKYKVSYRVDEIDRIFNSVDYGRSLDDYEKAGWKAKIKDVDILIEPLDEEDGNEDKFYEEVPQNFTDSVSIKTNFTFNIPQEILKEINEVVTEIKKIDDLLRNEGKMKDELVAKITENAISSSPELQKQLGIESDSTSMLLIN
jgi:alpha-L-fucosidase